MGIYGVGLKWMVAPVNFIATFRQCDTVVQVSCSRITSNPGLLLLADEQTWREIVTVST